jgi:hypothetical protein
MKATIPEMPAMPATWTPIAERARDSIGDEKLTWTELSLAVMTIDQARALAESGQIAMAHMHQPEKVVLVVRPSTRRRKAA